MILMTRRSQKTMGLRQVHLATGMAVAKMVAAVARMAAALAAAVAAPAAVALAALEPSEANGSGSSRRKDRVSSGCISAA